MASGGQCRRRCRLAEVHQVCGRCRSASIRHSATRCRGGFSVHPYGLGRLILHTPWRWRRDPRYIDSLAELGVCHIEMPAMRSGYGGVFEHLPRGRSEELAAVVGSGPLPRGQVVSKMWEYIRSHNLQNPENRREILADDKLRRVFGKDKVTMFEMNKHLAGHLK